MKSKLNTRQWELYNFLKNHPDEMFTQHDIVHALSNVYDVSTFSSYKDFHDSSTRLTLTKDIQIINDSDIIQKIIISTNKGIKLASREEYTKAIKNEYAEVFRKLKRIRTKERKAGLDRQIRMTEGKERDTVEAFTDSINKLKAARLAAGLTMRDVESKLKRIDANIDKSVISKMENNIVEPSAKTLFILADIYGVKAESLL